MASPNLPCPTMLRLLVAYDEATGELWWKARKPWMGKTPTDVLRWNTRNAGRPAFYRVSTAGYLHGHLSGRGISAHRAAWTISKGAYPLVTIDHIDRDPLNNRIANLREASVANNLRNRRGSLGATSQHKGVSFSRACKRWYAHISIGGKRVHIGSFLDETEAAMAYNRAAAREFGEFAYLNPV